MSKTSARSLPARLTIVSAVIMLIMPLLNGFALNYVMLSIAGDILLEDVYTVLGYISPILTDALSYLSAALLCVALTRYGGRPSAGVIAMYIGSKLIGYAGLIAATAWATADFAESAGYYLIMSLLYLALDLALFAALAVICALVRSRALKVGTLDTSHALSSPRRSPVALSLLLCCCAVFLVSFIGEAVNTVGFFIDYGFTATLPEIISMLTAYLMLIAELIAFYFLSCLLCDGVVRGEERGRAGGRP